jgi:uncharacterized protein YggE
VADTFEITAALPTQELDAGGRLIDVIEAVGVTKPNGVVFTVRVPKTGAWREALIAAARAEAAELEAIFNA